MASFNKINQFVEDLAHQVHDLSSDALTFGFTANANAPVATNTVLANLTEISYTNASARTATISSSGQTSGTYDLLLADYTQTATGGTVGPFQQIFLYNDTPTSPANPLIGWWDYGSEITLADTETFTADFTTYTIRIA